MSLTFKEGIILHHTAYRNVGLYTSISLAVLGVSRFYRMKGNALYNQAFIMISLISISLAIITLQQHISQMTYFISKLDEKERGMAEIWLDIAKKTRLLVFPIAGFTAFTFYRQVVKK